MAVRTSLQTVVVKLRDMSGKISQQKLHNRIFDAYKHKNLVLEAITLPQQVAMAQFGGQIPPNHPSGQPFLCESWADIVQVHNEHVLYQLVPLRAKTNVGFSVMRSICMSPGSPFNHDQRIDPVEFKMTFKPEDLELKYQFNAKSDEEQVSQTIYFDGMLEGAQDSGLITCCKTLSPVNINTLSGTARFLKEWMKEDINNDRYMHLKGLYRRILAPPRNTHLFIGTMGNPSREVLNHAKAKNVFIYVRKFHNGQWQYVFQPP